MAEPTNIKVLEQEQGAVQIERLSLTERKLFYELHKIDEDMVAAIEATVEITNNLEMPGLDELILRKIIMLSKTVQDMFDYPRKDSECYIAAPIIPNIFNLSIRGGAGEYYGKKKRLARVGIPGKDISRAAGALVVKFDNPVRCVTEYDKNYMAASHEEIAAIGISLNLGLLKIRGAAEIENAKKIFASGAYKLRELGASSLSNVFDFNSPVPTKIIFSTIGDVSGALKALFEMVRDFYIYMLSTESFVGHELNDAFAAKQNKMRAALEDIKHTEIAMPVKTPMKLKEPIRQFLTEVGQITLEQFVDLPELSTFAALEKAGLLYAFNTALLNGKDDPYVRDLVEKLRISHSRAATLRKLAASHASDLSIISAYRSIVRAKLGVMRADEVDLKFRSGIISSEKFLSYLTQKERDLVLAEYKRRLNFIEGAVNNKCEHRADVAKMNKSILEEERAEAFKKVMEWADSKKGGLKKEMIKCATCHYDLICPHVVELERLKEAPFNEVKSAMQKYISDNAVNFTYYCNICGAEIASREDYGNVDREIAAFMDEELKQAITQEVLAAIKLLRFKTLVNVSKLMGAVRDTTYPFIFNIDKKLSRSKTNTASVIAARKKLNVAIYVHAYLTFVVASNDNINWATMKTRPKGLGDYLKEAFLLINSSKNSLIRSIPGLSPELLKAQLIEAYKEVSKGGAPKITQTNENQALLMTLLNDPITNFIYWMNVIYGGVKGTLVGTIDTILGASISQIVESKADIYAKVKMPAKVHQGPFGDSASAIMKYISDKIYLEHVYVDMGGVGNIRSDFSEPYKKYYGGISRGEDEKIWEKKKMAGMKPFSQWPQENSITFKMARVGLGRIYDEEGQKHKWGKWVCDDGKEYTTKELGALGMDAPKIIDKVCSTCGVKFSEADKLIDDAKVREKLSNQQTMANFFKFYENRCPAGGSHEFDKNGLICSKCGIKSKYEKPGDAFAFFKKYQAQYKKDRATLGAASLKPPAQSRPQKQVYENIEWAFDFSKIMKVSVLAKVGPILIQCLGATEKQDYETIKSGKYIPMATDEQYNTRAYKIFGYLRHLIVKYNNMRFYASLAKPPPEIVNLVGMISKHKVMELEKLLADINISEKRQSFEYFRAKRKPSELVNYALELLCDTILFIADDKKHTDAPVTSKMRTEFIKWVVEDMVKSDEMRSKHGRINWNLVYGERANDEASGSDVSLVRAEIEDTDEMDMGEGEEEETPFSGLDDLDIDEDLGERDGDDDGGNVVRITGLD